jgi:hypothetical protein
MRALWRALAALALLAAPAAAGAEERILRFISDVQIREDSSLEVTETIEVRAERVNINHGIYRDFPTRYRSRHGGQVRVGFTFDGATLDGMPVPAATQTIANGVRIRIGDPDKYVDEGEHRHDEDAAERHSDLPDLRALGRCDDGCRDEPQGADEQEQPGR